MSYEPNVWVTGDRIAAEKLNHMEQGIANAGGTVVATFTKTANYDTDPICTCDVTFASLREAFEQGKTILMRLKQTDGSYQYFGGAVCTEVLTGEEVSWGGTTYLANGVGSTANYYGSPSQIHSDNVAVMAWEDEEGIIRFSYYPHVNH